MSQDEQDRILGRLFRDAVEAKRKAGIVSAELKNLSDGLKMLARELPEIKANMLGSHHASLEKYLNMEAIVELVEQREAAERTVQEFEARMRQMGL